jgi:hypothetical protein
VNRVLSYYKTMDIKKLILKFIMVSIEGMTRNFPSGADQDIKIMALNDYPVLRSVSIDSETTELGMQIINELGNKTCINNDVDLHSVVVQEFCFEIERRDKDNEKNNENKEMDIDRLIEKILERCQDPFRKYSFSFPISKLSNIPIDLEIGGEHKIRLLTVPKEVRGKTISLSIHMCGTIEAISEEDTIHIIEQYVKQLIGLARGLDIAVMVKVRIADLPVVKFEGGNEKQLELDPLISSLPVRTVFRLSGDNKDVSSNKVLKLKKNEEVLLESLDKIRKIIISNDDHANKIKSAVRLFVESESSHDAGKTVAFALMSIEAVLLESSAKTDITARLKEAVVYRLGTSPSRRGELRKIIGKLYTARSGFVHTGIVCEPEKHREMALELAQEVIGKEINDYG